MNNLRYYINKALNEHFALGAINFNNMESIQGIKNACKNLSSPAIISVSEGALSYMGDDFVMALSSACKKSIHIYSYILTTEKVLKFAKSCRFGI